VGEGTGRDIVSPNRLPTVQRRDANSSEVYIRAQSNGNQGD
jgi:hypothetical protein